MAEFAEMRTLDVWYARLSEQELMSVIKDAKRDLERDGKAAGIKAAQKAVNGRRGRPIHGTACRPCRSWLNGSMAATGS